MTASTLKRLTIEEFVAQYPENERLELVHGEVVEKMPPGYSHGIIATRIASRLDQWAERNGGHVGNESGFILFPNGQSLRGPDVFYVRADHIPSGDAPGEMPHAFVQLAPDLAVEVLSPSESAQEIQAKVMDFLEAGTPLVWVVYPKLKQVHAHSADYPVQIFKLGDTLENETVLPGFRCMVSELFR